MNVLSGEVILLFTGMALLSYITPGPDWAIISRHAFRHWTHGMWAALGVQSGLLFHMLVGALGASAILAASPLAFNLLQLAGALYLIYLALTSLQGVRQAASALPTPDVPARRTRQGGIFLQGWLANVLNPKAALFFISVLPQFVNDRSGQTEQVFLLGSLDIVIGLVWWSVFVLLVHRFQSPTHRAQRARLIEGVTGVALLLVGVGLSVTSFWGLFH